LTDLGRRPAAQAAGYAYEGHLRGLRRMTQPAQAAFVPCQIAGLARLGEFAGL